MRTGVGTPSSIAAIAVQRPSPESETRPVNSDEVGRFLQRRRGQVEQPGADHAAAPPDLGDLGQVEVVLVVLGVVERRRLGVGLALDLAGVGVLEDVQALGVGGHHPVLDPVVDHLHEVAGAVGAAVEVALLGGRGVAGAARRALGLARAPAPGWRRSGRGAAPPRRGRRSSGSSRARGRRRRRWCRSRRSRSPAPPPSRRGGCRRGSRSCRRRRSRRRNRAPRRRRRPSAR